MIGSILNLVFFGVVAITTVAAFFGVGFLLLVEEMPASRMRTHEAKPTPTEQTAPPHDATPSPAEQIAPPHDATPSPAEQIAPPHDATPSPAEQTAPPHDATPSPAEQTAPPHDATPNYSASSAALALPVSPRPFATHDQPAVHKGIAFDARLRFLRQQQALIELEMTEPNLSAEERRKLERQKAYWGRAIERMLDSP
jgi:outer membrane biosynthesis protein TonB